MSVKDIIMHPCVAGLLTDDMIKVLNYNHKEIIARVSFDLAEGTSKSYMIEGIVKLQQTETFDSVAFALLRELYDMPFPQLLIVNYYGCPHIMSKLYDDRALKKDDYYPLTLENFMFRYKLCQIIFFCKFVGCSISLADIRVFNEIPYLWDINSIGYKRCSTISVDEFTLLFGVSPDVANHIFNSPLHAYYDEGEIDLEAVKSQKGIISDSMVTDMETPNIKFSDLRYTIFSSVVEYFRTIPYDKDIIRQCIYIRGERVREVKGNRTIFPMTRKPRDISALIEQNFALIHSNYPYRIFGG
jgi:hypothetical protein